jgi:transposase
LNRRELTDAQRRRIERFVRKRGDKGRPGEDNRPFVDAVPSLARAGAPWRDLPREFDHWNSMFQRFRRWVIKKGVWEGVFNALVEYPDFEYLIIDPTIGRSGVRAAA